MAEETKVLLNIDSNLSDYVKEAADAQKVVNGLKDALEELQKGGKASAEEIEFNKSQLKTAQAEYRQAARTVDLYTKANSGLKGSYEQLAAQSALYERELKKQSDMLVQNADGTFQLSEKYVETSKKAAEAKNAVNSFNLGINNGTTNVGLYQQSITKALGGMGGFGKAANQMVGVFGKSMPAALGASTKGVWALNGALMAAGIGLIFMAIVGAIALLKKAWESFTGRFFTVADQMQAVLAGIRAAFDWIVDSLVSWVTGVENTNKSLKETYENAVRLEKETRKLADDMKQFEAESAKASLEMAKLEEIYKDVRLSDEERLKAAREARDMEIQRSEQELHFANENLRIQREKNALTKSSREDIEKEAELQRKVYEMEEKSLRTRIAQNRTLASLEKGMQEARDNYAQKERKAAIDLMKLRAGDNIEELKKALHQEYLLNISNENLTTNEKILIRERYYASIRAIDDNERKRIIAQNEEYKKLDRELEEARRIERLKNYEERKKERQRLAAEERNIEQRNIKASIDLDKERLKELSLTWGQSLEEREAFAEIEYNAIRDILQRQREQALANTELTEIERQTIVQQFRNQELQLEQGFNAAKQQMSDIRVQMMRTELQLAGDAMGAISELMGKETAAGKAFAVAQATINTYLAASQVLKDNSIPTTAGKVLAMIGIIGTGLANVRNIMKVDTSGKSASAPSSAGSSGYVATRAGGAIAQSPAIMTNVGQNIGVNNANSGKMENDNNKMLVDAIKDIKIAVSVEEYERVSSRSKRVEANATF